MAIVVSAKIEQSYTKRELTDIRDALTHFIENGDVGDSIEFASKGAAPTTLGTIVGSLYSVKYQIAPEEEYRGLNFDLGSFDEQEEQEQEAA